MSKSELIRFRCTESERKQLETAANKANLSISAYILSKLFVATKNELVATNESKNDIVATKVVATKQDKAKNVATKPKVVATNDIPVWKAKLLEQQANKKAK